MKRLTASAILAAWVLAACSSGSGPDIGPTDTISGNGNPGGSAPVTPPAPTEALFQVAQGILPYPTDLYFSGSTDGTLNLPANALVPNQAGLNALDGYSTITPIRVRFGGPIDPASLNASSVLVIRLVLDNATKAPIPPSQGGVIEPLVFGTDFTAGVAPDAGVGNTILEIRPTRPLLPSTGTTNNGYLVVLTNGITTATGQPTTPDADFAGFKAAQPGCTAVPQNVQPLCLLTGAHLGIAQAVGVDPANVTVTFSFSTQSTRDTLNLLANPAITTGRPIVVQNTGATTSAVVPTLAGKANLFVGTLEIPYYLSRTAPLTAFWLGDPSPLDANSRFLTRFNPLPVATETISIPVLVTVPNATSASGGTKPAAGWPALIFQHGLTRNRLDAVAVADAFADAGYVVVSIDMPLHGITDTTNPFYQADNERTLNLDLVDNATLAPPADQLIDGSGTHFVNVPSPLTTRDNLRQAAIDLLTLVRSLPDLNVDGVAGGDIDPTRVHFLGHSLGAIVGTVMVGIAGPDEVRTAVLANPGGALAQTIIESPAFGPRIVQGLAAQGIAQGTTLFEQFMRDVQTIVEAGDPLLYIEPAVAARPLLLFQVGGGGTLPDPPGGTSPPDQVVTPAATQRLVEVGEIPRITPPGAAASLGYVNFIFGSHGSLIDPTASLAVTAEMQREAIVFSSSLGTAISITDASVVEP